MQAAREHSTEADRARHPASTSPEVAPSQAAPDAIPGRAQAQRGGNTTRNPSRSQRAANTHDAQGGAGAGPTLNPQDPQRATPATEGGDAQQAAQQEPLPSPPSYQPINPPVEEAPEPDPAAVAHAQDEKQENTSLVEAQANQAPEALPEAPTDAPVEEVPEAPPADPAQAAAVSTDPNAAAAEAARTQADVEAASLATDGPATQGSSATAGPLTAASAEALFSAYKTAPPTQKAAAHAGFSDSVNTLVTDEHTAFAGALPQLHATMNGEADVEAAQQQLNLGEGQMVNEPGARASVAVEETPPASPFQDNEPVVENIFSFLLKLLANAFGGDGGRQGILDSLGNIRVSDRGANTNTGPAPAVPLSGDTDTKRVTDQQRQATEQATQAHTLARQSLNDSPGPEVITPVTMDEAFTIPTLNAPAVAPLPPDMGVEYFLAHDFTPEHMAAFDAHYGPEMDANLAQAQSQVDAAVQARDTGRASTIDEARAQHATLLGDAQQAQAQEVLQNRQLVTAQRLETHRLQDDAAKAVRGKLDTERRTSLGEINKTVTAEQKKVDDHFAQAETKAQAEVDKGNTQAAAERAAAEKKADEQSWWDKASDFVSSCFDALKSVVNGIFDAVRAVVNTIIDAAKSVAKTIIDKACQVICGLIDTFASLAKAVVKTLLSETFPEFTKTFCAFVDQKKEQAKQAVQAVADTLKAGVEALCDTLKAGLNAILDAYQSAINAAIDLVKAIASGDWAELARKLIIAGARVFGLNPDEVLALLDKAGDALTRIIDDPMGFVTNVLGAMNKGFGQFGDNFLVHLKNGFVQWLTGPIPGLKIPEDIFSAQGAFDLALQVLGLTPDQLKQKAARHIGEDNVQLIEQVWDHMKVLIEGGISGLWEHVKGELADMQDAVVGAIMDYVQQKVVQEAVMFIAGLFSPLPGIPKVIKVVWETYCWLKDNVQRIYAVVETVVNTMHDLATGNIQPAANGIEQALAGMVPVAIDLLAGILGLGDLPQRLQAIIQALQSRVDNAIDTVIEKFKGMFKANPDQDNEKKKEANEPQGVDGPRAQEIASRAWALADKHSSQVVMSQEALNRLLAMVVSEEKIKDAQLKIEIDTQGKQWSTRAIITRNGASSFAVKGDGSVLKTKDGGSFFTTTDIRPAEKQVEDLVQKSLIEYQQTDTEQNKDIEAEVSKLETAGKKILDQVVTGLKFTLTLDRAQTADDDVIITGLIEPNFHEWKLILDGEGLQSIAEAAKAQGEEKQWLFNEALGFIKKLADDNNGVTVTIDYERYPKGHNEVFRHGGDSQDICKVSATFKKGNETLTIYMVAQTRPAYHTDKSLVELDSPTVGTPVAKHFGSCALSHEHRDRKDQNKTEIQEGRVGEQDKTRPHDAIPASMWRSAAELARLELGISQGDPVLSVFKEMVEATIGSQQSGGVRTSLATGDGRSKAKPETAHGDDTAYQRWLILNDANKAKKHLEKFKITRETALGHDWAVVAGDGPRSEQETRIKQALQMRIELVVVQFRKEGIPDVNRMLINDPELSSIQINAEEQKQFAIDKVRYEQYINQLKTSRIQNEQVAHHIQKFEEILQSIINRPPSKNVEKFLNLVSDKAMKLAINEI